MLNILLTSQQKLEIIISNYGVYSGENWLLNLCVQLMGVAFKQPQKWNHLMLESICFMMLFMVLQSVYPACICTECKAFQKIFCESDLGFPFVGTNKKKKETKPKWKAKAYFLVNAWQLNMYVSYKADVSVCLESRSWRVQPVISKMEVLLIPTT